MGVLVTLRVAALALLLAACSRSSAERPKEAGPAARRPAAGTGAAEAVATSRLLAAGQESGGELGITAVHLESGRRLSLHGGERFPMASVFKLPVALAVLERVQAGELRLSDSLAVLPRHFLPTSDAVLRQVGPNGGKLTVRELTRAMLSTSDNTAADVLLERIGGPAAVTRHLRSRGVEGMRVDRGEGEMHWEAYGVADPPPPGEWTLAAFQRARRERTPERRDSIFRAMAGDPRDSATPDATAELLAQVHRGQGLAPEHRGWLLEVLERSPTGAGRLKGLLPPGTPVAHKTGTAGWSVNDVGIITLPEGRGHVAIAVYVKSSPRETATVERSIARAARVAYDHFTQAAPGAAGR